MSKRYRIHVEFENLPFGEVVIPYPDSIDYCQSLHGPSFPYFSLWDGDEVVCSWCGARIPAEDAVCGSEEIWEYYNWREDPWRWLLGIPKSRRKEPRYPDYLLGHKAVPWPYVEEVDDEAPPG